MNKVKGDTFKPDWNIGDNFIFSRVLWQSLFALVIGAAAFIAQMPSKSLAAPVDDPEFLSVDVRPKAD